ncbi:MAG: ATP-binding protein [Acidobacteria bacterium]|nr:ATP-binding protein [Acidobacteriota bacterium]
MITELRIEGFKSFGSPAEKLLLSHLNFVVGANASGKTNLLSALRFLKSFVLQDAEYAVNEFGGIVEVRNRLQRQKTRPKPLIINVRFDSTPQIIDLGGKEKNFQISSFNYLVQLDLRSADKLPEVEREILTADVKDNSGRTLEFRLERDTQNVEIVDSMTGDEGKPRRIVVPRQESTRSAVGAGFFSIPSAIFRHSIGTWRFYNINPSIARASFKEIPDVDLGPSGEHLSVILHKLEQKNGKSGLGEIISGLRSVIPGFKGIKTTPLPLEGKWAFQVLEDKIKGGINPDSVSDGTIRLLALMVIASRTAKDPIAPLVAIEEPENGLHPHISEHIVQILRTASERVQVIATTHNPTFLDYLEPREVILCDKKDGFTHLHRASDIQEIDNFRKHFALGELWTQGVLGGIP